MHHVGIMGSSTHIKKSNYPQCSYIFEELQDGYGVTLYVQSICKWEPKRLEAET